MMPEAEIELLREKLRQMKTQLESAIQNGQYTSLIRSKKFINPLHEFAVECLRRRLDASWIVTDKKVYGFPKTKQQDILVQPPQDGSALSVGPLIAVNIRSQMSSIGKNYDTLFERIFAEALNLHNRFPYMVLGYLYLLPTLGYDSTSASHGIVEATEQYDLEKYVLSFLSVADRRGATDVPWKYERVSLLIVDFMKDPPQIYDDLQAMACDHLVSQRFADLYSFEPLRIASFFDDVYRIAVERYYLLGFVPK